MADYPGAVTSFATLVDYVDWVLAAHQNLPNNEIVAVQTELGIDPRGAYATVRARLDAQLPGAPGAAGEVATSSGAAWISAILPYPPGHRYGLTLSNNVADATNDIDIAAGSCRDSTNTVNMDLTAMTKRLDANWAAGTNQGFRNSAAAITDTTYHIYAVSKALGAAPNYYAHTSATIATVIAALQAETGGADYLYARRIGSIIRVGGVIKPFIQDDKTFTWLVPVVDVNDTNPGINPLTKTLTVPAGIRVQARISIVGSGSTGATCPASIFVSDLIITATAPTVSASTLYVYINSAAVTQLGAISLVFTNTSGQVRMECEQSGATTNVVIQTHGWMDTSL
jgi:hypothetical protein